MSSSNGTRLEAESLSTLKSTFNFSRRARPPLPIGPLEHAERTPLGSGANKLSRRESRGGLRSIFTRNKAGPDASQYIPTAKEESVAQNNRVEKSPSLTGKTAVELEVPTGRVYAKSTSSTPERKAAIRMSMMPKSTKARPASRGNQKPPPKPPPKPPRRTMAAWDPPPLFQAYPQAMKHAQLASSTLSADSILRISNHRRNSSIREDIAQSGLGSAEVQTAAAKKTEKIRSKHRRQLSGSLSKADWTQKIYMLVTSGYLLQYSGEGSFDRLPEKMMQLGKDSVAFASDVIPGKHWVLQISQAMDSEGIPAPDSRSLLSRLTFRGADYRRTATSFLLILDSAEDLESWITIVRREIEALGGKKYVTETGKPKVDEEDLQLKTQSSQRYLTVQRDPDRFSNPPTPRALSCDPQWRHSGEVEYQETNAPSLKSQHVIVPSANRLSVATSSVSHDSQQQYEAFKDNSFRLSYMSSGQRTLVTSQGSSPACSPTQEAFITIEESRISDHIEEVRLRPNAAAISDRRRSMQTMQRSAMQNQASDLQVTSKAPKTRPHSTYGGPGRPTNVASPSTPNFSIPHSVGKRYALARIPDNPPAPISMQLKTPTRDQDASISTRGNRKSPPAPLKTAHLSPVKDFPSPNEQLQVFSPDCSSLPISRPPIVEIPPYSQSACSQKISILALESPTSTRRSSYQPPKSPVVAQSSGYSPRRQSSLQAFPTIMHDAPKTSVTAAPMPPTSPHLVPLPPSPRIAPFRSESMLTVDDTSGSSILQDDSKLPPNASRPRRPVSTQVLAKSATNIISKTMPPPNGTMTEIIHPATKPTTPSRALLPENPPQPLSAPHMASMLSSPSIQKLKAGAAKKDLLNRRSMPQLAKGPPPAPPPSYALPPIPGRSPLAYKGSRNSVQV